MEKQPVDDLFRRKLNDAEVKPSYAVWEMLQSRLGSRRIVPTWAYLSIAASVLVVGSFVWWAWSIQNATAIVATLASKNAPVKKVQPDTNSRQIANIDKSHESLPQEIVFPSTAKIGIPKIATIENFARHTATSKQNTGGTKLGQSVKREETINQQNLDIPKSSVDLRMTQTTLQPQLLELTPVIPIDKAQPKIPTQLATERTLVFIIEPPLSVHDTPVEIGNTTENSVRKGGLSTLFNKVKKAKDGDFFATSKTESAKSNRRGFGKFYDDVKESIQNNTID